jgi:hypothetical protein
MSERSSNSTVCSMINSISNASEVTNGIKIWFKKAAEMCWENVRFLSKMIFKLRAEWTGDRVTDLTWLHRQETAVVIYLSRWYRVDILFGYHFSYSSKLTLTLIYGVYFECFNLHYQYPSPCMPVQFYCCNFMSLGRGIEYVQLIYIISRHSSLLAEVGSAISCMRCA